MNMFSKEDSETIFEIAKKYFPDARSVVFEVERRGTIHAKPEFVVGYEETKLTGRNAMGEYV